MQNLVLGCGTDYSTEQLLSFVSTLRGAGYDGEIALVVFTDQLDVLAPLAQRYGVVWIPIPRYPQWLPPAFARRLKNRGRIRLVHQVLQAVLPPFLRNPRLLDRCGMHLQHFYHIACGRYFIYYSWLHRRRHFFANVFLTDVRDVIFQADPFACFADGALCCFMDPSVALGDEPINVEWMTTTYGQRSCSRHRGNRISCSGTTMGDVLSVLEYLRQMCVALVRVLSRVTGLPGVDQAVHNYLLWENRLLPVRLCENGRHAVMTLKNADARTFAFDDDGRLLNEDGKPAPVLHQYDFHPDLFSKTTPVIHGDATARN
jgi:hypothetical protein